LIEFVDFYDSFSNNVIDWLGQRFAKVKVITCDEFSQSKEPMTSPTVFGPGPHRPSSYSVVQKRLQQNWGKVPFLGICLGHQFMLEQMGMNLVQHQELKHGFCVPINWQKDAVDRSPLRGAALPEKAGVYHSLAASSSDDSILAVDDLGFVLACHQHQGRVWNLGVQFHPESFLSDSSFALLEVWQAQFPENKAV
jgi:anthranilate/para-aminobenzoate synthase component II